MCRFEPDDWEVKGKNNDSGQKSPDRSDTISYYLRLRLPVILRPRFRCITLSNRILCPSSLLSRHHLRLIDFCRSWRFVCSCAERRSTFTRSVNRVTATKLSFRKKPCPARSGVSIMQSPRDRTLLNNRVILTTSTAVPFALSWQRARNVPHWLASSIPRR